MQVGRSTPIRTAATGLVALAALGASLLAVVVPTRVVAMEAQPAPRDLADTIMAFGQFTTFARALQAAGLVDTLRSPGPYTLFAPTDAAFSKLPEGTLDALLQDPEVLRAVLSYHVTPGNVTAAQVIQVPSVRTVQGESVRITASSGLVRINDATVTQADILASNGMIHVIDTVLQPPSRPRPPALPRAGSGAPEPPLGAVAAVGVVLLVLGLTLRRGFPTAA